MLLPYRYILVYKPKFKKKICNTCTNLYIGMKRKTLCKCKYKHIYMCNRCTVINFMKYRMIFKCKLNTIIEGNKFFMHVHIKHVGALKRSN